TATQLGLRSFTESTPLDDLNYGQGVGKVVSGDPANPTETSIVKFTVRRNDGVDINVDLTDPETIGDVLDAINHDANNADGKLVARLVAFGNGIELLDNSSGVDSLSVIADSTSTAAVDLGLIPAGQSQSVPASAGFAAKMISAAPNSAIVISGKDPSVDLTGVQIIFDPLAEGVAYDDILKTLTVGVILGTTTANNVVEAVNQSSAASIFRAALDPTAGSPNDGSGAVDAMTVLMSDSKTLDGADVNQIETQGVFTALQRLVEALQANDANAVERAISVLDTSTLNLNLSRSELGIREQGLDVLSSTLDSQDLQLQTSLSNDYDADLAEVVSSLSARMLAYEASLRATASISEMTLLDYL
ncbi:MAG: hypothetical protein ACWGMZ_08315, partial [Thermoguttaceae bacterium]